ncbi:MAG: protoporphyrinogen oxidase [Bacteroidia bacterium]|nr:protoporphyrinogen oxidase [Bacteroidia bacterium]MDW8347333.1 protoporphyrinogen oxidase [Bacteroidia bacterium]
MLVIVGAGISGLTLGYYLKSQGTPYVIIEQHSTVGGNIQTLHIENRILELGPNTLPLKPHVWDLIQDLDLVGEVLYSHSSAKKRFILKSDKYVPLPSNPLSVFVSPFFNVQSKIKILKDIFKKPNNNLPKHETVYDFFVRHFGTQIADEVVTPFVSGIYAGDSQKLIVEYAFPTLIDIEKNTGSIIKGFIQYQNKQRSQGIISFKKGLYTLIEALHKVQKENIWLNTSIQKIDFGIQNHTLYLSDKAITTQQIVFTAPAYSITKYIKSLSHEFANQLTQIYYAPVCVVHSVYPKNAINHKLDGFGVLHPKKYNTFTLGTIFSSTLFANRTSENEVLLTTFIGEKFLPDNPQKIQDKVHQELSKYLQVTQKPIFTHLHIWARAIPQYEANYEYILPLVHQWEKNGIYFSGNWLNGISVDRCIEVNRQLAQKLA